jgi:DNA gyrase subunit A
MVVADATTVSELFLLTACETGFGKRTPMDEYPIKGRGGQGVINIQTKGRNGLVVGVALCSDADDAMFITESGMIVRTPVLQMRPMGRNTQGVRLVNLKKEDRLVSLEVISEQDLERYGGEALAAVDGVVDATLELAGDDGAAEASETESELSESAGADEEPAGGQSPAEGGDDDDA